MIEQYQLQEWVMEIKEAGEVSPSLSDGPLYGVVERIIDRVVSECRQVAVPDPRRER